MKTYEEFAAREVRQRWYPAILRKQDGALIGILMLSPENSEADLAIRVFRPYRGKGYGTAAFRLGARYCFDALGIRELHAGCYPHNTASRKMLERCGFEHYPQGDISEKHFITGEDVTQYDFILRMRP